MGRSFKDTRQELSYDASRPMRLGTTLQIGDIQETVTVTDGANALNTESRRIENLVRKNEKDEAVVANTPSQNVFNLQRRVAGILPVRMEVPRGGRSYRFVRPLVLEEETKITFQYKSR